MDEWMSSQVKFLLYTNTNSPFSAWCGWLRRRQLEPILVQKFALAGEIARPGWVVLP